jgi:acyl-CoA synthetase (AMP-forming)/AMP-acid ligase II/thioesterase domain-containing protein/acyl carrier protein
MHAPPIPTQDWLVADRRPLDWNGPVARRFTPIPDGSLAQPIVDQLQRVVSVRHQRPAIRDAQAELSYGELWDGASGLAETLAAETGTGDLVGILQPAGWAFPIAVLACLAAGRPFVALDPRYPGPWLEQALDQAQPALLITAGTGPVSLGTHRRSIPAVRLAALPAAAQPGWRPATLGPDEPACVLFTSGSTGRPKGIVNSQRNLLQRVVQSVNAAHISSEDRLLTLASPFTIVGVRDLLTALLAGASVRLLDPHGISGRDMADAVGAEAVTILFAFPGLLRSVVAASTEPAPASLRLVRVGGDTTLWSDVDTLRAWLAPAAAIQSIYAATEAPMLQWFVDDTCRGEDPRVPIGYPLPGNRLGIVDDHGGPVAPGGIGELVVASPYVALGQLVGGRWSPEPPGRLDRGPDRLFRTGDLVRQRPDGLLERVGRRSRQVKVRGARVELDGVEAALRAHPFVRDVAALARGGGEGTAETLVAYVSPRDQPPTDLIAELRELMSSVPPPMRPARYYVVADIPRLPSSKLDARHLQALDDATAQSEGAELARDAAAAAVPGDQVTQAMARVWADVLSMPVEPEDDFFDLGGDSLKAVRFMLALERELGRELSLTLINEASRFGELCELVRHSVSPSYHPLVCLKPGTGEPPVFLIHGIGGNVVEMLPMARRVTYPGEVIGIQARGLDRGDAPRRSVRVMAADYLVEVKARQPEGPYHLCGYSFGGLVAFEMASQLAESGDEVGLVGLFDTLMSPLRWPLPTWCSLAGRGVARTTAGLRSASLRQWPAELGKLPELVHGRLDQLNTLWQQYGMLLPRSPASTPARALSVAASSLVASARYRPGLYAGHLTLFTPASRQPGLPSAETLWRRHARSLSIIPAAGSHLTMFEGPNAVVTATALSQCLQTAGAGSSGGALVAVQGERDRQGGERGEPGEGLEHGCRGGAAEDEGAVGVDDVGDGVDAGPGPEGAGHRVDGHEGGAGEGERDDRQEAGGPRGLGVAGGQADEGSEPGQHVAEGDR